MQIEYLKEPCLLVKLENVNQIIREGMELDQMREKLGLVVHTLTKNHSVLKDTLDKIKGQKDPLSDKDLKEKLKMLTIKARGALDCAAVKSLP